MKTNKEISIYIVEDNKVFAMALKADIETSFTDNLINIQIFGNGEQAMIKFIEEKPQIVILDYHLDNMKPDAANGVKVLDWIKNENNETYVIMLTRDDNIDIALQSFKHGASDYIVKTDTQFRKIIFSLFNIFKMMEGKRNVKTYKNIVIGICLSVALLVGGVVAIQIFDPSILIR